MLWANGQGFPTSLDKSPTFALQDGYEITRVLWQVGLGIATAFDTAADGDGYRVVFIVHAWIVPLGLKSRDSCRW